MAITYERVLTEKSFDSSTGNISALWINRKLDNEIVVSESTERGVYPIAYKEALMAEPSLAELMTWYIDTYE